MLKPVAVLLLSAITLLAQRPLTPPGLNKLRKARAPIPSGIGSGVVFPQGVLAITTSTDLDTRMVVYPQGLKLPPNWLFTTATNRSDLGVEVVAIYYGNKKGALGVFDWSCSPADPCLSPNGTTNTGPAWVWTDNLLPRFNCNIHLETWAGATLNILRYSNRTYQTPTGWANEVWLLNDCTASWELVYSHLYSATQRDCSLTPNTCGWWGPIVETFFEGSQPSLKKLGFLNSTITIDGINQQLLTPSATNWVAPTGWATYILQPNHTWIVGS